MMKHHKNSSEAQITLTKNGAELWEKNSTSRDVAELMFIAHIYLSFRLINSATLWSTAVTAASKTACTYHTTFTSSHTNQFIMMENRNPGYLKVHKKQLNSQQLSHYSSTLTLYLL